MAVNRVAYLVVFVEPFHVPVTNEILNSLVAQANPVVEIPKPNDRLWMPLAVMGSIESKISALSSVAYRDPQSLCSSGIANRDKSLRSLYSALHSWRNQPPDAP